MAMATRRQLLPISSVRGMALHHDVVKVAGLNAVNFRRDRDIPMAQKLCSSPKTFSKVKRSLVSVLSAKAYIYGSTFFGKETEGQQIWTKKEKLWVRCFLQNSSPFFARYLPPTHFVLSINKTVAIALDENILGIPRCVTRIHSVEGTADKDTFGGGGSW